MLVPLLSVDKSADELVGHHFSGYTLYRRDIGGHVASNIALWAKNERQPSNAETEAEAMQVNVIG